VTQNPFRVLKVICGVVDSATPALLSETGPRPSLLGPFSFLELGMCLEAVPDSEILTKKPRRLAGAHFAVRYLHLRLAGVGGGVPHAASLIAVGLCLGHGYVSSKSRRGKGNSEREC
jgi:hypothetical protein